MQDNAAIENSENIPKKYKKDFLRIVKTLSSFGFECIVDRFGVEITVLYNDKSVGYIWKYNDKDIQEEEGEEDFNDFGDDEYNKDGEYNLDFNRCYTNLPRTFVEYLKGFCLTKKDFQKGSTKSDVCDFMVEHFDFEDRMSARKIVVFFRKLKYHFNIIKAKGCGRKKPRRSTRLFKRSYLKACVEKREYLDLQGLRKKVKTVIFNS